MVVINPLTEDKRMYKVEFYDGREKISVELGRFAIREEGDVALIRQPHFSMPLIVVCLIRVDGTIDKWMAEWSQRGNTYWHFHCKPDRPPTEAQRQAIAKLFYGACPFGLGGTVSAPVQRWCKFKSVAELEFLGNQGKKSYYA